MRVVGLLTMLLGALTVSQATSTSKSTLVSDNYDPLRDAPLVVRGRVIGLETKKILMSEWEMADVGMEKSTMMVTYIRVAVSSVLRGKLHIGEAVFGSIGGISALFTVDDEYIICAKWRPFGKSGIYVVSPYLGLYHRTDDAWTRITEDQLVGETEVLTDMQVRARIRGAK